VGPPGKLGMLARGAQAEDLRQRRQKRRGGYQWRAAAGGNTCNLDEGVGSKLTTAHSDLVSRSTLRPIGLY
jgi:hypothetical protein